MNYLIPIAATVATSVLADLTGYAAARSKWVTSGRTGAPPPFDWPLFLVRLTIGVITGIFGGAVTQVNA